MKVCLHAGCGPSHLPAEFYPPEEWQEIRLDIDPATMPDILGDIRQIPRGENEFDAAYASHVLEHLAAHEVAEALIELRRVLRHGSMLTLLVPDIQIVAEAVARGNLTGKLYDSDMGPIAPIDVLWGHRMAIADGLRHYQHQTGFVDRSLGEALLAAGFLDIAVKREPELFQLTAHARKP